MINQKIIFDLDDLSVRDFLDTLRAGIILRCTPHKDFISQKKLMIKYQSMIRKL